MQKQKEIKIEPRIKLNHNINNIFLKLIYYSRVSNFTLYYQRAINNLYMTIWL